MEESGEEASLGDGSLEFGFSHVKIGRLVRVVKGTVGFESPQAKDRSRMQIESGSPQLQEGIQRHGSTRDRAVKECK